MTATGFLGGRAMRDNMDALVERIQPYFPYPVQMFRSFERQDEIVIRRCGDSEPRVVIPMTREEIESAVETAWERNR